MLDPIRSARLSSGDRGFVERSPQPLRQLHRIIVCPEVNEEHPGLLGEHVTVNRGDLDAVPPQLSNQRVHLVAGDEEVAGDSGLAAPGRLEADPIRAAHRRGNRHAVFDARLPTRDGKLIDAAVGLPLDADD